MKNVVVIGSGNVAEALVRAIAALPPSAPYRLAQVAARNEERGRMLATLGGCDYTEQVASPAAADIYLMAVSDTAIPELAASIGLRGGRRGDACDVGAGGSAHGSVVVHTAGSVDLDALAPAAEHRAVLYPLQTFTAGRQVDLRRIPLFIEASTPLALETIDGLAQALSNTVRYTSSQLRAQLHLAAVFAANFSNHMYVIAEGILRKQGVEFDALKPLIEECADKAVASSSPAAAQTGPAVRGDTETLNRHMMMLDSEELRLIYKMISENIWKTSSKR